MEIETKFPDLGLEIDNSLMNEMFDRWLTTIVPYYQEAKSGKDSIFVFTTYLESGVPCEVFDSNGVSYYRTEIYPHKTLLAFNSKPNKHMSVDWKDFLKSEFGIELSIMDNFKMGTFTFRIRSEKQHDDSLNQYLTNRFREIVRDKDVKISLGGSMTVIIFDKSGESYVQANRLSMD